MFRIIKTKRPGVYVRRQICFNGKWVTLRGLAVLPICSPPRKWAGLAWETLASEPTPTPKVYKHHDSAGREYLSYYNPAGGEDGDRIQKLVTNQAKQYRFSKGLFT